MPTGLKAKETLSYIHDADPKAGQPSLAGWNALGYLGAGKVTSDPPFLHSSIVSRNC